MALDKFVTLVSGKLKDVFASVGTIYQAITAKTKVIIFNDSKTTTTGVATFHPTVDGTTGTAALFTNIYAVEATPAINTSAAIAVPSAGIKLISADKKTITVNVITGTNLLALGNTSVFAPDGTTVYITVYGD